jgi:hypothetical protein
MGTSATGGPLVPTGQDQIGLDDFDFDTLIHDWIVGLTALDPTLVRPAWQPDPPPLPDFAVPAWCAFGIQKVHNDWDAVVEHFSPPDSDGYSNVWRIQQIDLLTTWYGQSAGDVALQFRMGTAIQQNQELFGPYVKLVSVEDQVTVSEKIKGRWQRRVDVMVILRRLVQFSYAVLDLVGAQMTILLANGRTLEVPVNVTPPPTTPLGVEK